MTQNKFITAFQMHGDVPKFGISQNDSGVTTAKIGTTIRITHDYKKNDRMEIVFVNNQQHFRIESDDQLQQLIDMYRSIYKGYSNALEHRLLMWCTAHLNEC